MQDYVNSITQHLIILYPLKFERVCCSEIGISYFSQLDIIAGEWCGPWTSCFICYVIVMACFIVCVWVFKKSEIVECLSLDKSSLSISRIVTPKFVYCSVLI